MVHALDMEEPDDAAKIAYVKKALSTTYPVELQKEVDLADDLKEVGEC